MVEFSGRMAGYNAERFRRDLLAGIMVGIVALPLAMAFAIASGVSPDRGLYTAIVAGAAVAAFGGSRVQVAGPTGAMVPVLSLIVLQYGVNNLLLAGLVAGVMLIGMGLLGAGRLIRFIPFPVTTGFTSGIAVVIFAGQLNNFLGLAGLPRHEQFHLNLIESIRHMPQINAYAVATALVTLAGVLITPRLTAVIPGSLVGMLAGTLVASVLGWPVVTIGQQFGQIPRSLPLPSLPDITFSNLLYVLRPAFTIATLGAIESLLSCVVADARSGDRHDSNRELIGQGIGNCLAPLFGGIPATGAIARTATNIRNGAVSPVSGIVHSATLVVIMLAVAPWAAMVPLACLAPVLMVVAYNMSEIHNVRHLLRGDRSEAIVLAITLFLTVFADLTLAVEFGLLLAAGLFIKRISDVHRIERVQPDRKDPKSKVRNIPRHFGSCPQVAILNVEGPLFFGAAQKFEQDVLEHLDGIRTLVLRIAKVPLIDGSGERALANILDTCDQRNVQVVFSGLQDQPREILAASGLYTRIGGNNLFPRTGPALDRAISRMDPQVCASCPHVVFRECADLKSRQIAGTVSLKRISDPTS